MGAPPVAHSNPLGSIGGSIIFQVHDSQPPDLLSYSALGVTPNDPPKNPSLEKKNRKFLCRECEFAHVFFGKLEPIIF